MKRVVLLCAITVAPGVLAQQPGPAPQSGAAIPSTVTGALAQTLPARSGVPNPPPGSPEGLRLFLQNALAVARSGDHQKLAVLVKEMELPNYEAWFASTFGPAGSLYAGAYGAKLSEQDLARQHMLQATATWMNRIDEVRIRSVNDAPAAGDPYETGVIKNLKRPVGVFFAYYKTSGPRPNPIGYFVLVDGKFRWLSAFVVEVVTHRIGVAAQP